MIAVHGHQHVAGLEPGQAQQFAAAARDQGVAGHPAAFGAGAQPGLGEQRGGVDRGALRLGSGGRSRGQAGRGRPGARRQRGCRGLQFHPLVAAAGAKHRVAGSNIDESHARFHFVANLESRLRASAADGQDR